MSTWVVVLDYTVNCRGNHNPVLEDHLTEESTSFIYYASITHHLDRLTHKLLIPMLCHDIPLKKPSKGDIK